MLLSERNTEEVEDFVRKLAKEKHPEALYAYPTFDHGQWFVTADTGKILYLYSVVDVEGECPLGLELIEETQVQ